MATEWVTVHYEPSSYTWRLMKLIEAHPEPAFDFCYIDGGHSWDVTGYGFCLVDRLLRPGGWILFDDLNWTYDSMVIPGQAIPAFLERMPAEERATPQVRRVWDLLVRRHSGFGTFIEDGQWGFAQKLATAPGTPSESGGLSPRGLGRGRGVFVRARGDVTRGSRGAGAADWPCILETGTSATGGNS